MVVIESDREKFVPCDYDLSAWGRAHPGTLIYFIDFRCSNRFRSKAVIVLPAATEVTLMDAKSELHDRGYWSSVVVNMAGTFPSNLIIWQSRCSAAFSVILSPY